MYHANIAYMHTYTKKEIYHALVTYRHYATYPVVLMKSLFASNTSTMNNLICKNIAPNMLILRLTGVDRALIDVKLTALIRNRSFIVCEYEYNTFALLN